MSTEFEAPDGIRWAVEEVSPFDQGPSVLLFQHAREIRWAWGQPIRWWWPTNLKVLFALARPLDVAAG